MKRVYERIYVAKINGLFFAGLSKDKVYADSHAEHAFHCLINICAKPDGMAAFDFCEKIQDAHRMSFFEVSHTIILVRLTLFHPKSHIIFAVIVCCDCR